ncbi:hypothetical protein SteCoe_251 [Stentor coeruleus]|uniref:Rhodanese domain-containing protein n=1 Tax=Stentor coeruleus TaxID=5963 RepID=A0A1R2D4T6_9CILI|nr:hypothetical protein SteCoe_251 [Stentor coeruleus]
MNPFITIQECVDQGLGNFIFIYCSTLFQQPSGYISGSFLLSIEDNSPRFISTIRALEVPEGKSIVVYDSGDYTLSSKAFWGFRAAGFEHVRLLLRIVSIPTGVEIITGSPPHIKKSSSAYLPFNNEIVLTKEDLESKKTFYQQLVQINYLAFDIVDSNGGLLPSSELMNLLQNSGIKFSSSRASIVFGKKACLGGIVLNYVTGRSVAVVLDDINKPETIGGPRSRSNSVDEDKYQSGISGYTVTVDEGVSLASKRKVVRNKDTALCSNCLII